MNTEIKSADKFYNYFKEELLVKCDRILRDKGLSSVTSSDCISIAMDDLKKLFDEYHAQFKQPDISEDIRKDAIDYFNNCKVIVKSKSPYEFIDKDDFLNFLTKVYPKPIPTVDENELWMRVAEIITGYNIGKKNSTTKHSLNNRIDIIKKQFSITRK